MWKTSTDKKRSGASTLTEIVSFATEDERRGKDASRSPSPKRPVFLNSWHSRACSLVWRYVRQGHANELFDAGWYLANYSDVRESGWDAYAHYLAIGAFNGYDPNALFDSEWYLQQNPDVRAHGVNPLLHYFQHGAEEGRDPCPSFGKDVERRERLYGLYDRLLKRSGLAPSSPVSILREKLDKQFYLKTYLDTSGPSVWRKMPFLHYFYVGTRLGYSPNVKFSEEFYINLYRDVREAVQRGEVRCGFLHYLLSGEREGRAPRYDLAKALDWALPGVVDPILRRRAADIEARLSPTAACPRAGSSRTLWVFVPHFNPDIAFGGYRALFELLRVLKVRGVELGFQLEVITTGEEKANKEYFLWRTKGTWLYELFADIDVHARSERAELVIGPTDQFLCYSSWDALIASPLARETNEPRVISLIQEYEPIFSEFSAISCTQCSRFRRRIIPYL